MVWGVLQATLTLAWPPPAAGQQARPSLAWGWGSWREGAEARSADGSRQASALGRGRAQHWQPHLGRAQEPEPGERLAGF